MKVSVCEFPEEAARKTKAWHDLVEYAAAEKPEIMVLPEMPFCEWIFVGEAIDRDLWHNAIAVHEEMIGKFEELACQWVMSSRPVERGDLRLNEAFVQPRLVSRRQLGVFSRR